LSRASLGIPGKLQMLSLILAASTVPDGPLQAVEAKDMPIAFAPPGFPRNALSGSGRLNAMEAAGRGSGIPDPSQTYSRSLDEMGEMGEAEVKESRDVDAQKSSIGEMLDKRHAELAASVAASHARSDRLEAQMAEARAAIAAMEILLKSGESVTLGKRPEDETGFNRDINRGIIKISSGYVPVHRAAVAAALGPLLARADRAIADRCVLEGDDLATSFTLRFADRPDIAELRRNKCLDSLRVDGQWEHLHVDTAAKVSIRLFLGPDKNPCQIKTELQGRALLRAFKEVVPGTNVFLVKHEGQLEIDHVPVAKLLVRPSVDTNIVWNDKLCEEAGIDCAEINARFYNFSRSLVVRFPWSQ